MFDRIRRVGVILFSGRGPRMVSNEVLMHTKDFLSVRAIQREPSSPLGSIFENELLFLSSNGIISIDDTNTLKLRENKVEATNIFRKA